MQSYHFQNWGSEKSSDYLDFGQEGGDYCTLRRNSLSSNVFKYLLLQSLFLIFIPNYSSKSFYLTN